MKLLEAYSLTAGAKIVKPNLPQKFFPLPFDKYIIIQPYSKPSKSYQLWQDVLDIIVPELQKQNIHVVQIGAQGEIPLQNVYYLSGQTSFSQSFYLISHAMLVFGADSFALHAAGVLDKPLVGLYSNNYINVVEPYFGDKNKQILLEPDRKGKKPCFSFEENPRSINSIPPEKIAQSVLKLLGIENNFEFTFKHYGASYLQKLIEVIPDGNPVPATKFNADSLICRFDFCHNIEGLIKQLQVGKNSLVTDTSIDLNLIQAFKPNIKEVIYFIDKESNPEFIKGVRSLGIPFFVLYSGKEEDVVSKRLDYAEYGIINCKNCPTSKDDIKELKDIDLKNLFFKSNKLTLLNGKVYPSKYHSSIDFPTPGFGPIFPVVDDKEFWKESEHFYFLTKK